MSLFSCDKKVQSLQECLAIPPCCSSQPPPGECHLDNNINASLCFQAAQAPRKGLSPRESDSAATDQGWTLEVTREPFHRFLHQLWILELD